MAKVKSITMKTLSFCFVLTVLLTLSEGKQITVKGCGKNFMVKTPRIIGGNVANVGEFPWIVSLQYKDPAIGHLCGGTILNEHWIITAAHCVEDITTPDDLVIYAGLNDMNKTEHKAVRRHKISKIIMHEDYDPKEASDDIALLRTAKPIDIKGSKGYINGICLPETTEDPSGWAIVSGWGHAVENGKTSYNLKSVKVPIVPRDACNKAYDLNRWDKKDAITKNMICAGIINRDSCQNDSGGPLIQRNKAGFYTLIGVVSFGEGCGRRTHPGVYTNVAAFLDWIENNVD